ncbi:winged helix-turn-helix transcriptional regulator [Rhodococcus sp. HNM0563]|uniref:metalloregulator ArsR/SmtB family transcription factor n=1 Tax=Rhodococcus sp. HNM0563 TaxID=2716339 RepID=UPI00146DF0C8|nr:winged helix-turn-helix transcriptional regulator [Rhodococcus sp. HNM0563]
MHGFEVLSDPVRRRILEMLSEGLRSAGDLGDVIGGEFGISQPAVSQHLKVLRDNHFAVVHRDGNRRLYELDTGALTELEDWLARLRPRPTPALDALGTEIARGKRARRIHTDNSADEQRRTS